MCDAYIDVMTNNDLSDINPDHLVLLGEGVWGRVYDCQDGTVLKTARTQCAGLGDGREKIENEFRVLSRLNSIDFFKGLVPEPFGHGEYSARTNENTAEPAEIKSISDLFTGGFNLWLRISKMDGDRLHLQDVMALGEKDRQILGQNIGKILGNMHIAALDAELAPVETETASDKFRILKDAADQDEELLEVIGILEREISKIPDEIKYRPAHNDFNITNLLFKDLEVCAILDFAETSRNFPEKDLSDIINELPQLKDCIIRGYQDCTSFDVDQRRLSVGLIENGLYGALIAARNSDAEGLVLNKEIIRRNLDRIGHTVQKENSVPKRGLKHP